MPRATVATRTAEGGSGLASAGFQAVVRALPDGRLEDQGLGNVDRARPPRPHDPRLSDDRDPFGDPGGDAPWIDCARAYFAAAKTATAPAAVAALRCRGRSRPGRRTRAAALAIARRVEHLVAAASGDEVVATPFGRMRLADYLETRSLELTVHSADLARALGLDLTAETRAASVHALRLCADLATEATPRTRSPRLPDGPREGRSPSCE